MTDTRFDVLAIGNAIVDIIADTNDAFIASEGLTKGSMQLIDEERALERPAEQIAGASVVLQ